jgi:alpha-ribazole phosphatase
MPRGLILAARHPRTRSGARICHGRTDVPLAEPADAGAERLLAAVAEPIERIISSPLGRALDVAREVARRTGAPLHADDRLADQDFGSWEGQAWTALKRDEVRMWETDPVAYAPGGGESLAAVLRRVRRAWTRIGSSEDTTLVLTHAAPIQCLLHIAGGLPLAEAIGRGIAYGEVVRFEGALL